MNDADFQRFAEIWTAAYEAVSRGKAPTPGATSIAFDALAGYTLEQISAALTRHVRDPDAGRYGLTPADVARQIDGGQPTTDQIIGAARKPGTALAVLCRIEIGSWNLDNWNSYQLGPEAERCISRIPEWRQRIAQGELFAHEQQAMIRHGVNPKSDSIAAPAGRLESGRRELANG